MKDTGRKTPLGIEKRFDRFGVWLDGSWALRKAAPILNRYPMAVVALTWIVRILVGGVFVVSGVTKGIDPWGAYYKITEYLTAMHLPLGEWSGNLVLVLAFLLFSTEFMVGVSLVSGCFRKAAPITAALIMILMLPLSLWIAIADPVADCGCFGEFIVISNWATFAKNIILSMGVVWLLKFNRSAGCLIAPYLQWIAAVAMASYIMAVGYVGFWQQPMLDFRPYAIGTQLLSDTEEPEFSPTYAFIYAKDGVEREFSEDDDLPEEDSGWKFVRREEKEFKKIEPISTSGAVKESDFRIWSEDGSEDVTEHLYSDAPQMILLIPDISTLSMASSWKTNRLYDMASAADMEFFAVAAGSAEDIAKWRDLSSGQYPIYTADDTSIKELARGNPAIVSLDAGQVRWKTALTALLLSDDDEESDRFETSLVSISMSGTQAFEAVTLILVAVLAVLSFLSFFTSVWRRGHQDSVSPLLAGGVDAKKDEKKDGESPESRAAVTEEGKRDSDHGTKPYDHADIDA